MHALRRHSPFLMVTLTAAVLLAAWPTAGFAQSWWDDFFGGSADDSGSGTQIYQFRNYSCTGGGSYSYESCSSSAYDFAVPDYSTLTVEVWGGGGIGGGTAGYGKDDASCGSTGGGTFLICGVMVKEYGCDPNCVNGSGGQSSFNSTVIANGGKRGYSRTPGLGGTASGGDINITGNPGRPATFQGGNGNGGDAPNGGKGPCPNGMGRSFLISPDPGAGGCGSIGYGSTQGEHYAGGGAGGYTKRTYAPGELTPGTTVPVTVGFPGSMIYWSPIGSTPGAGLVKITWTEADSPPSTTCSVSFDENPVSQGEGTHIHWSSSNAEWMYINSIGYVDATGSALVQPSETTSYDGSAGTNDHEVECPATLTVAPPEDDQCVPSFSCSGDGVQNSCTGEVEQCSGGQVCSSGSCVCPAGQAWQNGQCLSDDQCFPTYVCHGNDLYQRSGAQCATETFIQSCSYACSAGACLPPPEPPEPGGAITAIPSLVSVGDRSTISWTTERMLPGSCLASEDNPVIHDIATTSTGSFLTSPLDRHTTYTLSCTTEDGAPFSDSATVRLVPMFQEQ